MIDLPCDIHCIAAIVVHLAPYVADTEECHRTKEDGFGHDAGRQGLHHEETCCRLTQDIHQLTVGRKERIKNISGGLYSSIICCRKTVIEPSKVILDMIQGGRTCIMKKHAAIWPRIYTDCRGEKSVNSRVWC